MELSLTFPYYLISLMARGLEDDLVKKWSILTYKIEITLPATPYMGLNHE